MPKYLFRFGFCGPDQLKSNEENDWDDESSDALFIEAENERVAEDWGVEVAEYLVRRLFEISNWNEPIPSWKESAFAYWIEKDVTSLPKDFLDVRLAVKTGELPSFSDWYKLLYQ